MVDTILRGRTEFTLLPEDEESTLAHPDSPSMEEDEEHEDSGSLSSTSSKTYVETQTAHDIKSARARRKDIKQTILADVIPPIPGLGTGESAERRASFVSVGSSPDMDFRNRIGRSSTGSETPGVDVEKKEGET